jgi:trehalose-6-phosphatase
VKRTPGSRIELKQAAIAWHYRGADPEYGSFQAKELLTRLEDTLKRRPFKVLRGARVIEVRHEQVTKGNAVRQLLQRYSDADFLFCAGDDRTDEEMMDAIPEDWRERSVTCWVGARSAHATYWRESSHTLLVELAALARLWRGARRDQDVDVRRAPRKKRAAAKVNGDGNGRAGSGRLRKPKLPKQPKVKAKAGRSDTRSQGDRSHGD